MTTYEKFVKPQLKPKDEYEHILILRIFTYILGSESPAKNRVDIKNTNEFDEIIVNMQKDGYEIIDMHGFSHDRALIIIRYK